MGIPHMILEGVLTCTRNDLKGSCTLPYKSMRNMHQRKQMAFSILSHAQPIKVCCHFPFRNEKAHAIRGMPHSWRFFFKRIQPAEIGKRLPIEKISATRFLEQHAPLKNKEFFELMFAYQK